jgi:hypothetical protein
MSGKKWELGRDPRSGRRPSHRILLFHRELRRGAPPSTGATLVVHQSWFDGQSLLNSSVFQGFSDLRTRQSKFDGPLACTTSCLTCAEGVSRIQV